GFTGGPGYATGVAVQPDGKLIVVGNTLAGTTAEIARLNANGSLDTTFNHTGQLAFTFNSSNVNRLAAVAVQPSDLHTATGGSTTIATPGGGSPTANALAIQSDGKIVVAGGDPNSIHRADLARITATGALDTSFAATGATSFNVPGASTTVANGVAVDDLG